MRYRVRTPEGELEYPSLRDVEQAYVQGLVDPQDEVLEEGSTLWRKAESLPTLARARRTLFQRTGDAARRSRSWPRWCWAWWRSTCTSPAWACCGCWRSPCSSCPCSRG